MPSRKVLSWCIASLLGGVLLFAFGYYRHYFEGDNRWLTIGAFTVCWFVISGAVWIANNDPEMDKVEKALRDDPENHPWNGGI